VTSKTFYPDWAAIIKVHRSLIPEIHVGYSVLVNKGRRNRKLTTLGHRAVVGLQLSSGVDARYARGKLCPNVEMRGRRTSSL
jgi:hypothetical protein